ncbi:28S ribosomal protein S6, mitochondrial [Manis pentadactyla]|uniref:28S ribosomal protein S6, mitochondrial n=1 Tax=Manis pentadactyla TaxID=143292 RepID=UPI00255C93F5|nr:28S ribosomal protein S6, mitochondrial [Manis pentadactyla]
MKRKAWKVPAGSRAVGSRRGRGRRVRGGLQLRCPSQLSTRRRPAQQLPGPGPQQGQLAAGSRAVEGARRGRLKEGAWRAEGRGDPSAQLPEPLSPGSRRRSVLSPPGSFSAQEPVRSSRSPPLLRPGGWLGPESRAVRSGMPRYELALILKAMQRPETAAALKRTIEALMDRGAIVRNLENLGERALPYKISTHSQQHSRGGYFLLDFYAPTTTVESIMDHLSRDIDVIRPNIVKHPLTQEVKECEGIVPIPLEEKLYSTKKRK